MVKKTFRLEEVGLEVEVGKYARQADGAAWIRHGDNIILSTVVATKEAKDFIGFFPLTVEYREKTSAAGKIPGGYIKREGRLSDTEVLMSRLTDRSIRPLFPSDYFNEVQLLSSVYSSDGKFPSSVLSIVGASIALSISSIPFGGPIGAVQASLIDGELVFNSGLEQSKESAVNMLVVGTESGICMVEGNTDNHSEDEMVELLFRAHEEIKKQIAWQHEIIREVGKEKVIPEGQVDWAYWGAEVAKFFDQNDMCSNLFDKQKDAWSAAMREKKAVFKEYFASAVENGDVPSSILSYLFDSELKNRLPDAIIKNNRRFDGRNFETVRPIEVEVGMLPQVHGSATFQRGETLAMASVTLGTGQDAQKVETLLEGMQERSFMLHYNFPPFAVGEVRAMRGVGRREIGHGYLAENSFKHVLPTVDDFPYTIRSVVDVLDCNGSSSMATVCSTTMGLLDAGVPLKKMVAGVAMGLIQDSSNNYHVLTDILGSEDALGLMDFKVTGTDTGIMAIQMDIKAKEGLSKELMRDALERARVARLHILSEMQSVMDTHRDDVSALAPKVVSFHIDQDKIGAVIGPSGKVIKEIIAETDAQIDIENDGLVKIFSKDRESGNRAMQWVKVLAGDIDQGTKFTGIIRRFAEFGIFVELVPGKDGLIHVSNISKQKQRALQDEYKVNDTLPVEVISADKESGRIKLVSSELL